MSLDSLERTRRRFVRRQRSRRWLRWRAILAVVVATLLLLGAVWLVFFSTVLAVKGVQVQGAALLTPDEVRAAAGVPADQPLARVDLDRIEGRLRAVAAVRLVEVAREWPDQIVITLIERTAVAAVPVGSGFKGIDSEGVLFREFATRPRNLPLVTAPTDIGKDAMREGAAVVAALPSDLQDDVDHVEVESVDRISLVLRDDRAVIWGSADQSADKARVLAALLEASPKASQYDVSAPGQPTTRD